MANIDSVNRNCWTQWQEGFGDIKEKVKQLWQRIKEVVYSIFASIGHAIESLSTYFIFAHKVSQSSSPNSPKVVSTPPCESVPGKKPEWFSNALHEKHMQAIDDLNNSPCTSTINNLKILFSNNLKIASLKPEFESLQKEWNELMNEKRDEIMNTPYDVNKSEDENRTNMDLAHQKFLSEVTALNTKVEQFQKTCKNRMKNQAVQEKK